MKMNGREVRQLTEDEAIALEKTGWWKERDAVSITAFQLLQDRLCCPFSVFHQALDRALGRTVYFHEVGLNREGLIAELAGVAPSPSFDEIMAMLPADKTMTIRGEE